MQQHMHGAKHVWHTEPAIKPVWHRKTA